MKINKTKLRKHYEASCMGYAKALCEMWGVLPENCWWVADKVGEVLFCSDNYLDMDNIIYCVEHDVTYEEYLAFQEMTVNAQAYGLNHPSLDEWHRQAKNERQLQELVNELEKNEGK